MFLQSLSRHRHQSQGAETPAFRPGRSPFQGHVGEVMVHGIVKGTLSATGGNPTIPILDPATIGRAFWDAYTARGAVVTDVN